MIDVVALLQPVVRLQSRSPVAVNAAFAIAGRIGGNADLPDPVGGLLVFSERTSMVSAWNPHCNCCGTLHNERADNEFAAISEAVALTGSAAVDAEPESGCKPGGQPGWL